MKHFIFSLLLVLGITTLWAKPQEGIPEKPVKQRLVTDLANILSDQEEQQLEAKLVAFYRESSTQVAVVTVKSLNGYDDADFATRLAQKWGIGSAKYDNGILLLVKPKMAKEKGQVFIATGYGLEGAVTDLATGQIVRGVLIPHFKKNDYYGGIYKATDALIALSKGEYNDAVKNKKKDGFPFALLIIIVFLFLFVILSGSRKKAQGEYQMTQSGGKIPMWLLLEMMTRNNGKNDFDDFTSGRGGFGGFSGGSFGGGGGFGGFGGGSFGGGGAGGSW